jgi:hypothetical protein
MRADDQDARERRKSGAGDTGIRTRMSDGPVPPVTPELNPDWSTTFQLRWWEHLRRRPELAQTTSSCGNVRSERTMQLASPRGDANRNGYTGVTGEI